MIIETIFIIFVVVNALFYVFYSFYKTFFINQEKCSKCIEHKNYSKKEE